jgi:hypothetical protein
MKKLLLTLIGLINFCFADRVPHLFILHLNGINTTEQEAIDNAEALRRDVPLKSNMLTFSYVWNPSADEKTGEGISNLLSNLVDVKDQKKYEYITQLSLEDCTDAWMKVNPWDRYPKGTPEYDKVKENIIPKYKDMLEKLSGENFDPIVNNFHNTVPAPFKSVTSLLETPYTQKPRYSEYDILSPATANLHNGANDRVLTEIELDKLTQHNQRQAEELNQDAMARLGMTSSKNYLDTKNMVILVPHSQGNLYANELYNYLTGVEHFPPNQIAIFGIASPASKNVGDWMVKELQSIDYKKKWGNLTSYITSTHDHVMDLVRITHPGEVLPSNISGLSNESDHYAGHNLINVYLKN